MGIPGYQAREGHLLEVGGTDQVLQPQVGVLEIVILLRLAHMAVLRFALC